jgi:hypothetical protein
LASGEYDYSWFVTLERDNEGKIAAIATNVGHRYALSSKLLSDVVTPRRIGRTESQHPSVATWLGSM